MNPRILVIDDEASVRRAFELALEETDFQVDTAASGEVGVAMEKAQPYDLVFLDLRMPGMNGVETLRALKQIDPDAQVYIVTAFHKEFLTTLKSASQDGVEFELLKKPIGLKEIRMVVNSVLGEPTAY